MRRLIAALVALLIALPAGAARQFTLANSEYCADTTKAPFPGNSSNWAIAGLVYRDTANSTDAVFGLSNSSTVNRVVLFQCQGNSTARFRVAGSSATMTISYGPNQCTSGSWHHFVVTRRSSTSWALIFNGVESTSTTNPGSVNANVFTIGAYLDPTVFTEWDGRIAELCIYNVSMTAADAQMLYNGGDPISCATFRPDAIIDYFPLDQDNCNDAYGGLTMTDTNTPTLGQHPRVIK